MAMKLFKNKKENYFRNPLFYVARPGFEPRQTVPKTVVLPLYYRASNCQPVFDCFDDANIHPFFISPKLFWLFFG
jgi:hypothetical protein